jgi:hypothetical protein
MTDRQYCDHAAALAAETVRRQFAHLAFGAVAYPGFGAGVLLIFGNDRRAAADDRHPPPAVARLRAFLAIDEVGIRELGFGATADRSSWAMLVESRRDVAYGRRLVRKAYREAGLDHDDAATDRP